MVVGLVAPEHVGSSQPRDRTVSLALEGRSFTIEPPGSPLLLFILWILAMRHVGSSDILTVAWCGSLWDILFGTHCFLDLAAWFLCQIKRLIK